MKFILMSFLTLVSFNVFADHWPDDRGRYDDIVNVNVRGQGYFPDQLTADAVCRLHGHSQSAGFTQWKQAGNRIQGQRSYDGRPYFQSEVWNGGMALDSVNCWLGGRRQPTMISVRGQGYYPDEPTANAICLFNGFRRTVGFTQWKQAGDRIEGLRSYDGRPYFQTAIWGGGMALDSVNCR